MDNLDILVVFIQLTSVMVYLFMLVIITVFMDVSVRIHRIHHPLHHDHDHHHCHGRVHCVRKDGDCESGRQGETSLRKSQEGEVPERRQNMTFVKY